VRLNLLNISSSHKSELVGQINHSNQGKFPSIALYAVDENDVLGQVGLFHLPMFTNNALEDVGVVWALITHPTYTRRGIGSYLLKESHSRMLNAGLRFSTLSVNRSRVAYKFFQYHGYEEMQSMATAIAHWETAHQPTRLFAQPSSRGEFDPIDKIFKNLKSSPIGYPWRNTPFAMLHTQMVQGNVWILWENKRLVGFAVAQSNKTVLNIRSLFLLHNTEITEAVAALVAEMKTTYVIVNVSRPADIAGLRRSGYQIIHPNWDAFMLKTLIPDVTIEDARTLFGIGTDRFSISLLDMD
jgi:GNAT superfamily N-acetyltransferase